MEFIYDIEFALYIFQDTSIIYHTILQSGWCTSDHQHHLYKYIKQGSSRNSQSSTIFNFFMGSCDSGSVNNVGQRLTT